MSRLIRLATRIGEVPSGETNRVGGEPIGMTAATWPRYDGKPMHHVITLSRELLVPTLPPQVAAVAVFVSSPMDNEAWEANTEESAVVFLGAEDLARGTTPTEEVLGAPLEGEDFLEGGVVLWNEDSYRFDEIRDDGGEIPEAELSPYDRSHCVFEYMNAQYQQEIEGHPVRGLSAEHTWWCQADESPPGHAPLFSFFEELVPGLNCGNGYMYVTANADATEGRAWWQC